MCIQKRGGFMGNIGRKKRKKLWKQRKKLYSAYIYDETSLIRPWHTMNKSELYAEKEKVNTIFASISYRLANLDTSRPENRVLRLELRKQYLSAAKALEQVTYYYNNFEEIKKEVKRKEREFSNN